jgi:hypothetical protein
MSDASPMMGDAYEVRDNRGGLRARRDENADDVIVPNSDVNVDAYLLCT